MFVIEKSVIEKSVVEKASERYQESRSQLNPQPPQLALSFPPEVVRGAFGIPQSPSRQIFSSDPILEFFRISRGDYRRGSDLPASAPGHPATRPWPG